MSSTIKNVLCKTCLILIIGFTFLTTSYAHAQPQTVDLRVDGDNGIPAGDGLTWATAFQFLQDALAEAASIADPDTTVRLWVAATDPSNPYRPDRDAANPFGTGDRASTFLVNFNNVQLLGGFPPGGGDLADRDPAVNLTVLSGDLGVPLPPAVCGDPGAGGCFVDNGTPGCDDATCCEMVCVVDPHCCEMAWDELCADFANFVCGTCGEPGSGSCFEPNDTPGCEDGNCCALVCDLDPLCCIPGFEWTQSCVNIAEGFCIPPVSIQTFHVVTANGVDGTVRIDGFTITDGLADAGVGNDRGAGMFISSASLAVVRVMFIGNAAPTHGGGAMNITDTSDPLVVNCEFIANTGMEAGALHTEGGMSGGTFVNCLFSSNTSTFEGGAINPGADGDLNFINCTFADNTVGDQNGGGAIFTERLGSGLVNLTNCILWGNRADGNPSQIEDSEDEVSVTYSCVEGTLDPDWDDGFNINDDPSFFDPFIGNYRLAAGSPCLNVGNNADVPCDEFDLDNDLSDCDSMPPQPTPDLDLGDRIVGGDVDMGAYESVTCLADFDGSCDVGVKDLLFLLGAWGPCGDCADCPADFDDSCDVGVKDLLFLLGSWGTCPCAPEAEAPSIQEAVEDAGLIYPDDWNEFLGALGGPDEDNYICWMDHYLNHCTGPACPPPICPDDAPFGHHE